jgi:hypothetical protein
LLVYPGSCFFGYKAENSQNLKARIISKDPLFQDEKIPARIWGRCQVNLEKSSKNKFQCLGKSLPEGYPTPPRPDSADFTRGEKAILGRGTWNPHAGLRRGKKEGGKITLFLIS